MGQDDILVNGSECRLPRCSPEQQQQHFGTYQKCTFSDPHQTCWMRNCVVGPEIFILTRVSVSLRMTAISRSFFSSEVHIYSPLLQIGLRPRPYVFERGWGASFSTYSCLNITFHYELNLRCKRQHLMCVQNQYKKNKISIQFRNQNITSTYNFLMHLKPTVF